MATRTRREIRSLGDTWNDTMLWYAKAVHALRKRPVTKKASWRYLAAMHDFDQAGWINLGYLAKGEALPKADERKRYWSQCQHQTWYFLPWHRAYLHSFEDIVRDAIKSLDGPADWALPYWNYSDTKNPDARKVPQAFLDHKLPESCPTGRRTIRCLPRPGMADRCRRMTSTSPNASRIMILKESMRVRAKASAVRAPSSLRVASRKG